MEINFLACFRTYPLSRSAFAQFLNRSRDIVSSRRRHHCSRFHFCVYVQYSAFTRSRRLSISTSLERMCVGNAKRSEVHYRELGHGEYITRRIWPGYVADSMLYNLTRCSLTPTINSWIKEAAANCSVSRLCNNNLRKMYMFTLGIQILQCDLFTRRMFSVPSLSKTICYEKYTDDP